MLKFESEQMLSTLNKKFNTTLALNDYSGYVNYVSPIDANNNYFEIHVLNMVEQNEDLELYFYDKICQLTLDSDQNVVSSVEFDMQKYSSITYAD